MFLKLRNSFIRILLHLLMHQLTVVSCIILHPFSSKNNGFKMPSLISDRVWTKILNALISHSISHSLCILISFFSFYLVLVTFHIFSNSLNWKRFSLTNCILFLILILFGFENHYNHSKTHFHIFIIGKPIRIPQLKIGWIRIIHQSTNFDTQLILTHLITSLSC